MPPHERRHQLPVPKEPLPELSKAERMHVLRLARLVKSGQLWKSELRLHEERGVLVADWSDDGGAALCT